MSAMALRGTNPQPTPALIGEAGPEAVIPLDKAGGFGQKITIVQNIRGSVISEREMQSFALAGVIRGLRGY